MKIGILGAGRMGATIGTIFAKLGHQVTFSYSRSPQRLESLAESAGGACGSPHEAAKDADIIVLAVHWSRLDDVLTQAGSLSGKTVISCTNPLNASDSELVIAHTDSGAETIARKLPDAQIVAAFQATPSEVLMDVFNGRNKQNRPDMLYCGDNLESKSTVRGLLSLAGFEPVDAGVLRMARYIEPFAMLATALAYDEDSDPRWVYRFGRYN
ncbi:NADPH-dependent F420 reductase [Erwinia sp. MYb416]|uniref:NADPH-dependent F420 reductase n=1 Tax=Erwinia sp. MYb416 TaxID=3108532 RepID=UPI0030A8A3BB